MYESYLEGKRVALVGPGSQTEIMKLGSLIDSYDIVARAGHYNVLVPEEIGSRTDIIMENFWFWDRNRYKNINHQALYDEYVKQGVKYFNHVWPIDEGLSDFKKINQGRVKLRMQPDNIVMDIRRIIGSPTKGFCSIYDMLTFPIKELFLVGFSGCKGFGYRGDVFTNPFSYPTFGIEYIDPKESVHNLSKWTVNLAGYDHPLKEELEAIKKLCKDPRVKCDEWFERILQCD